MSGYTPGPWTLIDDGVHCHLVEPKISWMHSHSTHPRRHAEIMASEQGLQEQANARLIDAAPELYEALLAAVSAKDLELDGFRRQLGRLPLVRPEWLELARAALAKATGDAQGHGEGK